MEARFVVLLKNPGPFLAFSTVLAVVPAVAAVDFPRRPLSDFVTPVKAARFSI
jgi:hypothetical protein